MSKVAFHVRELKKLLADIPEALLALQVLEQYKDKGSFEIEGAEALPLLARSFPLPSSVCNEKAEHVFALFSDGACRGNPGPGAYGFMGQDKSGHVLFESSGIEVSSTNNRMELSGALFALVALKEYLLENNLRPEKVFVISDSKYLIDGMKSWIHGWKKRGWKKADKKAPENLELWQELDLMTEYFPVIEWVWVKGHAGHPQNEHCDSLANQALDDSGF